MAMSSRAAHKRTAGAGLLALVFMGGAAHAQLPPTSPESPNESASLPTATVQGAPAPCVQPAPMVRWEDYQGPFAKTVGLFARKLERKSVRSPRYKPGAALCTLELKDKFDLFVLDSTDPVTFLAAGFNAGIGQAENDNPKFGQGAAGYGKRFGANLADQASAGFFKDLVYPTLFSQDPRYYRTARGGAGGRLVRAMRHVIVAHHEDGSLVFNYTEWLGTASTVALGSVYHGSRQHGVAPAVEAGGYDIGVDMGFDVLREFWPEIARKFKLPFREEHEPGP